MSPSIPITRMSCPGRTTAEKAMLCIALILFAVVMIRNAWLCDDAYITYRTVDNFVNGYGLTWNTAERVQAYTNPLWMFVVSAVYAITREIYYSSLILSLAISFWAVNIIAWRVARSTATAILTVVTLTCSKAFVDYSTSGLENPLTYLLLALFFSAYDAQKAGSRKIIILSFLTSCAALNRMDNIIIYLPVLAYTLRCAPARRRIFSLFLGLAPLILWEAFSLLYYGFPFPNTAYAKLGTAIPAAAMMKQGVYYTLNSFTTDPLTLSVIAAGIIIPFLAKDRNGIPVAIGIALFVIYIIWIGGDFMMGRFFATPFFCAAAMLSRRPLPSTKIWVPLLTLITIIGLCNPRTPVLSGTSYGAAYNDSTYEKSHHGISDVRAFYYKYSGLFNLTPGPQSDTSHWRLLGRRADTHAPPFLIINAVGVPGFCIGPHSFILDPIGLADPLLARTPCIQSRHWRIGHWVRYIPIGYIETIVSGKNCIRDKDLAAYYDALSLICRGPLCDKRRLATILKMNIGGYDKLLEAYASRMQSAQQQDENMIANGVIPIPWNQEGCTVFTHGERVVSLGKAYRPSRIEISLESDDSYQITYARDNLSLATQVVPAQDPPPGKLVIHLLNIPPGVAGEGFDTIFISPREGDGIYRLGYLRLID